MSRRTGSGSANLEMERRSAGDRGVKRAAAQRALRTESGRLSGSRDAPGQLVRVVGPVVCHGM